jgi:dihydroorotase
MLDLVVEGNAYLDGEIKKCCIGIENGKITEIKKILQGDRHLDYGDKLIIPAGIDIHVHFRDPGYTNKEDFGTGTMAAAFGGYGCVFDMPNTNPPVISKETILDKVKVATKKAYIDFGIYSSLKPKASGDEIKSIASECTGFKIYLASTTGQLLFSDLDSLSPVLYQINESGRIPAVHAESEAIIRQHKFGEDNKNKLKSLHEHLLSRPNSAEVEAISNLLDIAHQWDISKDNSDTGPIPKTKMHIHLCHITCAETVELLRDYYKSHLTKIENNNENTANKSKSQNLDSKTQITCEVTPHHLLLNEKNQLGSYGKVNPPLRRAEDQAALWSALADGTIQILASDHAPHTIDEKDQEFEIAPAGIPGVETLIPLMLSNHKHHNLRLDRLVEACSLNPSTLFNLPKGKLAQGFDGDLIVVDFYNEEKIKVKNLHSKCDWSPFDNMDAIFPVLTIVRGNIIIKDGNLESDPGIGKFQK